jgi:Protein of unknown function (DUF2490)
MLRLLVILSLSIATIAKGQQARTHTTNHNAWIMYFGNHKFTSRIGIHVEAQVRRSEFVTDDQQLLLRTGLDYYLKDNSRLTIGYAFVETYPYGDFAVANAFPEHRIWEQYATTQTLGKLKLAHRYRLEQRMLGNAATGQFSGGRYENRFRYMAKLTYPLNPSSKHPLFIAASEEIFVNWGKDVAYNIFDQNRLYAALGYTFSSSAKIEVGFLYQIVELRSLANVTTTPQNRIEDNYTFQVGFFHTLDLAGKKE